MVIRQQDDCRDDIEESWELVAANDGAKKKYFPTISSTLLGNIEETSETHQTNKDEENIVVDDAKLVMTMSDRTPYIDSHRNSDGNKQKEVDEEMEAALSEDIYSIMFITKLWSPAFWYSLVVFGFQISFIALLLVDLIDWDNTDNNPLQVPAGMTKPVTLAAGLCIALLVAVQDDMIEASVMLAQGYQMLKSGEFDSLLKTYPDATMSKWFFSASLQYVAGLGLLIVIFILTMQSESVLGMALNFAALMFVSEIDNVAFGLAKRGFICSPSIEKETMNVSEFKLPKSKTGFNLIIRRVMFVFLLAILYAGYGVLIYNQRRGYFVPQQIGVQFGDEYDALLSPMSGMYIKSETMINGKFAYYQDSNPVQAMFAYCHDPTSTAHQTWTFSWWADPSWKESFFYNETWFGIPRDDPEFSYIIEKMFIENDPCNWSAKSQPAQDIYDITKTEASSWQVVNDLVPTGDFVFQHFALWPADCRDCSGHGQCGGDDGNTCICEFGYYGSECEFENPCPRLALDQRNDEQGIFLEDWVIDTYSDGTLKLLHDRPVYINRMNSSTSVLVTTFTGRRWEIGIISNEYYDMLASNHQKKKHQGNVLQLPYDDFMSKFFAPSDVDTIFNPKWFLTSTPVDHQSSSYAFTPVGLSYYEIVANSAFGSLLGITSVPDLNRPFDAPLICSACTRLSNTCFHHDMFFDEHKCLNPATNESVDFGDYGVCNCVQGTRGYLCEYLENCIEHDGGCYNNGVCHAEGSNQGSCNCTDTGYEGHLCQFPDRDNET